MQLEKHAKPQYFTASTEVVLCGIKHNAKLLLRLRGHTELHLALGTAFCVTSPSPKIFLNKRY